MTAAELADDLLDALAGENPLLATFQGIPGHDHELPDLSLAAADQLRERASRIEAAATASDDQDHVTLGLVVQQAAAIRTRLDARLPEFVLAAPIEAAGVSILTWLPQQTFANPEAEADYVRRLAVLPAYYATVASRHRLGISTGWTPVDRMARNALGFIDRFLGQDAIFAQPLSAPHAAARDRLVASEIRPALVRYREVLATEVLGHGRPDAQPGLCWLEGGEATYAALAGMHTTTAHTPRELHQMGLDLISALSSEYATIGARAFGISDPAAVRHRLRTDESMRWRDGEEMLAAARAAVSRATAAAPGWFHRIPSAACEVRAVPAADAPVASAAYYLDPAPDGSRPGIYFLNTHEASSRDRFIAETVAFHEAVPGHHFQVSLAQTLTDVPKLRTVADVTAYNEGWALYTERLADEMGLFSDDVMRLGMLAEDSVRAARLVVDTGLHALGWPRSQCVDYLRTHTAMSEVEIQTETDRYIECPGQALAYMVGRLEIQRLRSLAASALGPAFDVKDFHDVVLDGGPLPLGVLEAVVRAWIGL